MSISDVIQISSFVAEVFGLSLTVIGLVDRDRKQKLEQVVTKVLETRDFYWRKYNKAAAIIFGGYFLGSFIVLLFGEFFESDSTFYAISVVLLFAVTFLAMVYGQLRRVFPQHQVLLLGLCISFMSLFGELYQVCAIFN